MYAYPYFFDYEVQLRERAELVLVVGAKTLCYLFLERMLLARGEYHNRPLRKIP